MRNNFTGDVGPAAARLAARLGGLPSQMISGFGRREFDAVSDDYIAQTTASQSAVVSPHFLEFDYSGRDSGRKIVKFLCRIAPLIGMAEGEAECRITTNTDESFFEFYTICNCRLYKQEAELVKAPPVEVCLKTEDAELQYA